MKKRKTITIKIKLKEFVEWYLTENSNVYQYAYDSFVKGSIPLKKRVKDSKQFFKLCEYLPLKFVANYVSIKKYLHPNDIKYEEVYYTEYFKIQWV